MSGAGVHHLAQRLDKALGRGVTTQPRRGQCVLCRRDWMECPHTRAEVDGLLATRAQQRLMERLS